LPPPVKNNLVISHYCAILAQVSEAYLEGAVNGK